MSSPFKNENSLSPITTNWHNRSLSSVASDAATFHSALAHTPMEVKHMSPFQDTLSSPTSTSTPQPKSPQQQTIPFPKLEAVEMARKDSGYAAGQESSSSSRRTSTSSSTRRLKYPSKRTSTRPSPKRASRSFPLATQAIRTSTSSRRPSLHTRHTTSSTYQQNGSQPYQFLQFPTLQDAEDPSPPPPPPTTCQYWTSDSTRRLEYAAIDAASRGVKGFFLKLLPDCILPPSSRRVRFHRDDEASDAGSVRRYRLMLPEEKGPASSSNCETSSRPTGLRRLTSGWGKRRT